MIVLCSSDRRSNILTLPSAPQETKTSTLLAQKRTSKTSLSWAISCVLAVRVGISQIVQVVSIEDVMISDGCTMFQSKDVIGAVCSGDFEFESSANGESFCNGWLSFEPCLVMLLDEYEDVSLGKDHNLK